MITLKDLFTYSGEAKRDITRVAEKIHPKLLHRLDFDDFFDDTLLDATIYDEYKLKVLPLITKYEQTISNMVQQYQIHMLTDMMYISPNGSYSLDSFGVNLSTGKEIRTFEEVIECNKDFLPHPSIEFWYYASSAYIKQYEFKPFWSYGYYDVNSSNIKVTISSYSNPSDFIYGNRNKFPVKGGTMYQKLIELAETIHSIPYDLHIPPTSEYDTKRMVNNELTSSVNRHYKFYKFKQHIQQTGSTETIWSSDVQNGEYVFVPKGDKK